DDGVHGAELWVTDGTSTGTALLSDIVPGTNHPAIRDLVAVGDRVFFTADDGLHGREPWVSDGTALGTRLVTDLRPGRTGSNPVELTAVGTRHVFYRADDGVHGDELWRSDGTAAGTVRVSDIGPGDVGSAVDGLTLSAGNLLFAADDGVHGREPWSVFPGATAQVAGVPCGVEGRTPRLRATDPAFGTVALLTGEGAVPGGIVHVLLG